MTTYQNTSSNYTNFKKDTIWISYSAINDFLKCPRAYYISYIYKNPETNRRVVLMSPHLALGSVIHSVLEPLSRLPVEDRLKLPLVEKFEDLWQEFRGKRGGFASLEEEEEFKKQGLEMLKRVKEFPGPIAQKAIKIRQELPSFYLSEEEGIKLCGNIDWLRYHPEDDTVHIVDFKTGKNEENQSALQLQVYLLLASYCQSKKVNGASFWFLYLNNVPTEVALPPEQDARINVLMLAKRIKEAKDNNQLVCRKGGCFQCQGLEQIVQGQADYVGVGQYNKDVFILK